MTVLAWQKQIPTKSLSSDELLRTNSINFEPFTTRHKRQRQPCPQTSAGRLPMEAHNSGNFMHALYFFFFHHAGRTTHRLVNVLRHTSQGFSRPHVWTRWGLFFQFCVRTAFLHYKPRIIILLTTVSNAAIVIIVRAPARQLEESIATLNIL